MDDRLEHRLLQVYGAVEAPRAWNDFLEGLCRDEGLLGGCLALDRSREGTQHMLWTGYDPGWVDEYLEHWSPHCLWTRALYEQMPAGRLGLSERLVDRRVLKRSACYNECSSEMGMEYAAGAWFDIGQAETVRFAIQRTERQGDFEETTARRLSSLLPHIGQALRLSFSTESPLHSRLQSLDASGTPAVIVDRTLNLRHRNPAADVLLRGAGFPRDSGGRLQLASPDLQKCLREAVREVLGGCGRAAVGLTLTQPQDLTWSTALVTEAPPASRLYPNARHGGALVTIAREDRPLDLDADDLAVLFDLTPTETRIAGLIGSGVSSERCAAWMDVNRATLRWHLKHVFQKTGTDGQIDLAVLMQSLGAART
jgi:DNA-binding CsgD family transcriptional regulator